MTAKAKNPVWAFFASVQLALFLIGLIASTSIIGTVVEQNKPDEHYVKQWGEVPAKIIQAFDLDDMYGSVWFLALLGVFSLNLTVCSLDRIPNVIRVVRKDGLDSEPDQLRKMKLQRTVQVSGSAAEAAEQAAAYLSNQGWPTASRDKNDGILLFAQKGAWTRYGVYVVHLSILVILLGAIIGSPTVAKKILHNPQFAFKGGVSLPETASTGRIFSYADESEIPLGFIVRCNFFDIDFYANGMPKDYVSGLTIIEQGREVLTTVIEVNKPLKYKGVTFYQASYNNMKNPVIRLRNLMTGTKTVLPIDPQHYDAAHSWQDGGVPGMIRIMSAEQMNDPEGPRTELKIWMMDSQGPPSMFTVQYNALAVVERPGAKYELRIGPQFATGLQVAKDPGVLWVYSGCALMLLGLYVAFFMSHHKIWAYVHETNGQAAVVFIGSANKHSAGFEKSFSALADGCGKTDE